MWCLMSDGRAELLPYKSYLSSKFKVVRSSYRLKAFNSLELAYQEQISTVAPRYIMQWLTVDSR